jgi:hypothetical protein
MDFVEPTKASLMHALKPVGWVEPFAKPIIFADSKLMGIAPLYPSYGLRAVVARLERSAIRDLRSRIPQALDAGYELRSYRFALFT